MREVIGWAFVGLVVVSNVCLALVIVKSTVRSMKGKK